MIRKIMVVLLVTVMLFCSFSVDKEPAANNASDVSSDFDTTSRSAASNTSSGNIPSGGFSETAQNTTYAITGQQFYTHTVSQFLKLCKSGGSEKVNSGYGDYSKYDCNKPFLQVVNDSKTLLVPVIKNDYYKLDLIQVMINQPYCRFTIKTPDSYLEIHCYHPSLFAGYEDASIPEIIETLANNGISIKEVSDEKITKGTEDIKWDTYYYLNNGIHHMSFINNQTNSSSERDVKYTAAFFKVKDFLVKIVSFGETEWDDNYFDYIDYERISW